MPERQFDLLPRDERGSPRQRLQPDAVREIVARVCAGEWSQAEAARRFGVTRTAVNDIMHGRTHTALRGNVTYSYPKLGRPRTHEGCSVTGCPRKHYGIGLCNPHYQQAYRAKHRRQARVWQREANRRYLSNPENAAKARARVMLGDAVRFGKLGRPDACEWCDRPCKPEAHHEDHRKPFDVVWICVECHRAHHVERGKLMPAEPQVEPGRSA